MTTPTTDTILDSFATKIRDEIVVPFCNRWNVDFDATRDGFMLTDRQTGDLIFCDNMWETGDPSSDMEQAVDDLSAVLGIQIPATSISALVQRCR
jgi:hypothetical protein